MRTSQGNGLSSLRTVQSFLDANAPRLGSIPASGARKKLDALVVDLDGHADTQSGSDTASRAATQKHQTLRQALIRDHMAPIAKIAASELPDTPELQPLKLPQGRPSAERLKAMANGMAQVASQHKDVFIAAGLPDDFITQLENAANAMLGTVGQRQQSRVVRGGATKGLGSKLGQARRVVHALDAMVKSALAGDPALLAEWNIAKRVQRVPGGPPKPAAPTSTAPASTTPTSTAPAQTAPAQTAPAQTAPAQTAASGSVIPTSVPTPSVIPTSVSEEGSPSSAPAPGSAAVDPSVASLPRGDTVSASPPAVPA